MLRSLRLSLLPVLVVVALCAAAPSVFAAESPWKSVDVVLHDDASGPILIVAGELADEVRLPAEVALAAPPGLKLEWAGEVLGGPMDQDPSVTPRVKPSGATDVYSFSMAKGRSAQIELSAPALVTLAEGSRAALVSWVAPQDVPLVNVMIRVPAGSQVATATTGGAMSPGPSGYQYYQRTFENVKAGAPLHLGITFVPPAASATGASATGASQAPASAGGVSGQVVPILLLVAFVVAGGALVMSIRRKLAERAEVSVDAGAEPTAQRPRTPAPPSSSDTDAAIADVVAPAPGSDRRVPRGLMAAGIVVALVAGVLIAVEATTRPQVADGKITQQIAQIDQCTSATFPLELPEGTTLEKAAEELFAVLKTARGVGQVTVYADQPRIEVGFCESSNTEQALRQSLATTGYVAAQ